MHQIKNILTMLMGMILLLSCARDYKAVIPDKCTALAVVRPIQMSQHADISALGRLLNTSQLADCGLDIGSPLYAFETADGLFGLVARVSSKADATRWLTTVSSSQKERRGYLFATIGDGFLAALGDDACLLMGPALSSGLPALQQRMIRCLENDADASEGTTAQLFALIDRTPDDTPIAIAATAAALPQQLAPLVTLGNPEAAVTATISQADSVLTITSTVSAIDGTLPDALADSIARFRPIEGTYGALATDSTVAALFMNTDGETLLSLFRATGPLRMLLAGTNRIVDMDNIIRAIDGETAIAITSFSTLTPAFRINAKIAHANFLDDIDYWKQSCPIGSAIINEGPDAYIFSSPTANCHFGVDAPHSEFYAYTSQFPLTAAPVNTGMAGHRLCLVASRKALEQQDAIGQTVLNLITPLLGNAKTLVWYME